MMKKRFLMLLLVAGALAVPAPAVAARQPVTQTFQEFLPGEPETPVLVHGLHYRAVTFSFTKDGVPVLQNGLDGILYHGYGPRYPDYALGGTTAGVLGLTFDRPTRLLHFELALNTASPLAPGAWLVLYDRRGRAIETLTPGATSAFSTVEYSGKAVKSAELRFNTSASLFAIDNLTYLAAGRDAG
jgi:hypothetical protein